MGLPTGLAKYLAKAKNAMRGAEKHTATGIGITDGESKFTKAAGALGKGVGYAKGSAEYAAKNHGKKLAGTAGAAAGYTASEALDDEDDDKPKKKKKRPYLD